MITYTSKEFTEDAETEKEIIESEDPQIILNAVEFFKRKLSQSIETDKLNNQ